MNAGRIDLHTHSDCSDGLLSPAALVALAAQRGVELLALTDHDTVSGCAAAGVACAASGVGFIAGVELSCRWRDREIHVIGLRIDAGDAALLAHCAAVLAQRRARVQAIAQRLARAGLPGSSLAELALAAPLPTRTHLARALCQLGLARSVPEAFERWLARGRPGYIGAEWPSLAIAVERIVAAGGCAVLAHPHRYRLARGALQELAADFAAAGGAAIEVSLHGMGSADAERAATLARRHGLAGSVGSDFHEPGLPWRPLGRFAKLPGDITPITAQLVP